VTGQVLPAHHLRHLQRGTQGSKMMVGPASSCSLVSQALNNMIYYKQAMNILRSAHRAQQQQHA
jgi:hypothetical protein